MLELRKLLSWRNAKIWGRKPDVRAGKNTNICFILFITLSKVVLLLRYDTVRYGLH